MFIFVLAEKNTCSPWIQGSLLRSTNESELHTGAYFFTNNSPSELTDPYSASVHTELGLVFQPNIFSRKVYRMKSLRLIDFRGIFDPTIPVRSLARFVASFPGPSAKRSVHAHTKNPTENCVAGNLNEMSWFFACDASAVKSQENLFSHVSAPPNTLRT